MKEYKRTIIVFVIMLILIIITVCSELLLTRSTDIKYEIDTSYIVSQILLVLIPILTIFISIDADKKTIKAQLKIDQLQNIPNLNALLNYSESYKSYKPTTDSPILLLGCPSGEINWTTLLMEIQNVNNVLSDSCKSYSLIERDDHQRMLAIPLAVEPLVGKFAYRLDEKALLGYLDTDNIDLLLKDEDKSIYVQDYLENYRIVKSKSTDDFKKDIRNLHSIFEMLILKNDFNTIIDTLINNKPLITTACILKDGIFGNNMRIDLLEEHVKKTEIIDFNFYNPIEGHDYIFLNYKKFTELSQSIDEELKRLKNDL